MNRNDPSDDTAVQEELPLTRANKVGQDMIAGRLGLIEGVRKLVDLRHGLFAHGDVDPDFGVIMELDGCTRHLPVGADRERWALSALAEKDQQVKALELDAQARVLAALKTVLDRLNARAAQGRRRRRAWWPFSRIRG